MARRVVVTGAAGLVGRRLVGRLLARGDDVVAIMRVGTAPITMPGASIVEMDLSQPSSEVFARLGRFDAAVHLAQSVGWHDFPSGAGAIAAVGVAAAACLAEAAAKCGATRFVLVSSGGIYGPAAEPISESAPAKPAAELGFYLAAKACAEQLIGYFAPRLIVHILRPFFIYGPGQAESFLVPRLIRSVREGRPIRLDGGRGPLMNPIFVDDAAKAFLQALDIDAPLTLNIAGPQIVSIRDIALAIAARLALEPAFDETPRGSGDYVADTRLMERCLGKARIGIAEGIGLMLSEEQERQ